jgi:hypothetical protein
MLLVIYRHSPLTRKLYEIVTGICFLYHGIDNYFTLVYGLGSSWPQTHTAPRCGWIVSVYD